MLDQLNSLCERLAKDPLLVQGAGGNLSWKDGDALWIKASGMWIAHASQQNIFVPVRLSEVRKSIELKQTKAVTPINGSLLKPSIETQLHACLPQQFVLHLHPVELLAYLVRTDYKALLESKLPLNAIAVYVDYVKPGPDLAQAMLMQLNACPEANLVFLQNHGVVIAGNTINEIENLLNQLLEQVSTRTLPLALTTPLHSSYFGSKLLSMGYVASDDIVLNQLALNDVLVRRLKSDWALYPDHVVFLGRCACVLAPGDDMELILSCEPNPPFVFVVDDGLYESSSVSAAHRAQLKCYLDLLMRLEAAVSVASLNPVQVDELLNWDAEKLRMALNVSSAA